VRPADGDHASQPRRLREQLGAVQHRAGGPDLRQLARDRGRHDQLCTGRVRRVVADRGVDPGLTQLFKKRRLGAIAPGNVGA
jgi:hypothetical protein